MRYASPPLLRRRADCSNVDTVYFAAWSEADFGNAPTRRIMRQSAPAAEIACEKPQNRHRGDRAGRNSRRQRFWRPPFRDILRAAISRADRTARLSLSMNGPRVLFWADPPRS